MTKREEQYLDSLNKAFTKLLNRVTETDVIDYETKIELLESMIDSTKWRLRDFQWGE